MSETPESTAVSSGECADCVPGRTIALALLFAAFAAYCAADFATGGRLTTWVVGLAASARGGTGEH